jgi:transcriptional regulator with XRE-family HTH domain
MCTHKYIIVTDTYILHLTSTLSIGSLPQVRNSNRLNRSIDFMRKRGGNVRLSFTGRNFHHIILGVSTKNVPIVSLLKEIMHRKKCSPRQLAADLDLSHAAISRWLSCKDVPSIRSCNRLAEYSGISLQKILSIAGYIPTPTEASSNGWPEFREYASKKYSGELDEDLITLIEDLIERRRVKKREGKGS